MMQDRRFYVYAHKRLDTGAVFYIGKGCGPRVNAKHGRSTLWKRIAEKHGFESVILHCDISEQEAFDLEVLEISRNADLCNFTAGGEGISGYRHTEGAKKRIRDAHSGKTQPAHLVEKRAEKLRGQKRSEEFCIQVGLRGLGRVVSDETRAKMSKSHTGRVMSPESIEKTAAWHRGRKRSGDVRQRMSDSHNHRKRSVQCIDTGEIFRSLEDAAQWVREASSPKATRAGIWASASGKREKSYGLKWRYVEPT